MRAKARGKESKQPSPENPEVDVWVRPGEGSRPGEATPACFVSSAPLMMVKPAK